MIGREFGGKELSGGEKQRMAIARVFYRDASLVILDEPTAAVDAVAEQEIFESVYGTEHSKTILTISHRFSTVKKSDVILVIEQGRLVEQGSHKELMENAGTYHKLYTAQASSYQD
jgi:ABC-type multidrug transport system fused ATPase/permease subunit